MLIYSIKQKNDHNLKIKKINRNTYASEFITLTMLKSLVKSLSTGSKLIFQFKMIKHRSKKGKPNTLHQDDK